MAENTESSKNDTNKKRRSSRGRRIRRTASNIIMICLAAIVAVSGWKIYTIMHEYDDNQGVYDGIADAAYDGADIDFDALRAINPDIIGWLRYEGTLIDYPVVQGEDNEKYLHTMFDGSYSGFGTLFADAVTEAPFMQFNTIIYGHHMLNGSMFGDLRKLKDTDFCREHPELELITPEGRFRLRICAFLNQPADSVIYTTNIRTDEDKEAYINCVRNLANYITTEEMTPDDRLVILSTCAYEYQNARYMVVTRMIPWDGE